MAVQTDTNIFLRISQQDHPMQSVADTAVKRLTSTGEVLYYLPQNIREFWNVCTRPLERNGLGFSHAVTEAAVQKIETTFSLLPDGPDIYYEWRRLVLQHSVSGAQVHDCYIAAAMRVRGVDRLLTFNTADFTRYDITVLHPADV